MDTDTLQLYSPRTGKPAITIAGLANLRSGTQQQNAGAGNTGHIPSGNIRFNADASTEDLVETFQYAEQLQRSWPGIRASVARELEHRGVNVGDDWRQGSRLDTGGVNSGRESYGGTESRR